MWLAPHQTGRNWSNRSLYAPGSPPTRGVFHAQRDLVSAFGECLGVDRAFYSRQFFRTLQNEPFTFLWSLNLDRKVREGGIARQFFPVILSGSTFPRTHRDNRAQMPGSEAPKMQIGQSAAIALDGRAQFLG